MAPRMTEARKIKLMCTCTDLREEEFQWFSANCKKSGILRIKKAKAFVELSKATSNLKSAEGEYSQSESEDDISPDKNVRSLHGKLTIPSFEGKHQ